VPWAPISSIQAWSISKLYNFIFFKKYVIPPPVKKGKNHMPPITWLILLIDLLVQTPSNWIKKNKIEDITKKRFKLLIPAEKWKKKRFGK